MKSQDIKPAGARRLGYKRLLSTTVLAAGVLTSGPSFAQDADTDEEQAEDDLMIETVVVTGSRIRRTNLVTQAPVTVFDSKKIEMSSAQNIIAVVNDLPQVGEGFEDENASYSFYNAGLNAADLRNFGANRTLTLINGRRTVATLTDGNAAVVDTGMIPVDLIDRVEISTGGASAVYGADAVTGVINYILKDSYEGVQVKGHYGTSTRGDTEELTTSLLMGGNFDNDRGNAVMNISYTDRGGLFYKDRDQAREYCRFVPNEADTGPEDGVPDQVAQCGLRSAQTWGLYKPTFWGYEDGAWSLYTTDANGDPELHLTQDQLINGWLTESENGGVVGDIDRAITPNERFNVFASMRYQLTDSIELKTGFRFAHTQSGDDIGPVFANHSGFDRIQLDNPYVSDGIRDLLQGYDSFTVAREHLDMGPRRNEVSRTFYAVEAGLEGEFDNGWYWDVYYQGGATETVVTKINDLRHSRYAQALDAVLDEDTGEIVCRDQSNGCVPLNILGPVGVISEEARDWVTIDHTTKAKFTQHLAVANVGGDVFELPAGMVGVNVGVEYRREDINFKPSGIWEKAEGFFQSQFSPIDDHNEVKEAYAEVRVPIIKDAAFAKEINFEGAIRMADYRFSGTNSSYKLGLDWQVTDDIRLRGVQARAVRAPSMGEMFDPGSRGASSLSDPCDALNIGANDTRRANCAAEGFPDGWESQLRNQTKLVFSSGNRDLEVEKADTLTLGVVFTPTFLPNFHFVADFYDIKMNNAITRFGAQDSLNNCYDNPQPNSFCDSVERNGDREIAQVLDTYINASRYHMQGIDFEAGYDIEFGNESTLSIDLYANHLRKYNYLKNASEGGEPDEWAGEVPDMKWRFKLLTTLESGPFAVSLATKYWSSMKNDNLARDEYQSPNAVPAAWRFDLFADYDLNEDLSVYAGVDNLFDKMPPLHPWTYRGRGHYSLVGRYVYAGFRWRL